MKDTHGNTILEVYFDAVPSPLDPPNARKFYQALGMAIIAWGRLEGNLNALFVSVLNITTNPEVNKFYLKRDRLAEAWNLAFETTPSLMEQKDLARSIVEDMEFLSAHRDQYIHGLWQHFVSATPPTMRTAKLKPRSQTPKGLLLSESDVSLDNIQAFIDQMNRLNISLKSLAEFLLPLRGATPRAS
jgi:hypothetical protein